MNGSDIKSEFTEFLFQDANSAVQSLNESGAEDIYAVCIVANSGFFSGLGLASNSKANLISKVENNKDPTLGPEYFELSCDEWDRYDWKPFAKSSDYLVQLEDPFYDGELPFGDDEDEPAQIIVSAVIDVLKRLDLQSNLASNHAGNLYAGLAFSDASTKQETYMLKVGEALNNGHWSEKLRAFFGASQKK